ncbi:hypothetical protein F4805DRAFT_414598 [Annulohypoxylon moriforme]|nr:hypothetical protein F4805DRAFT_414598 [Annulohypoxylon moriforme]
MDVIRNSWPALVDGVDKLFQNEVIPQVVPARSVETLVARSNDSHETLGAVVSIFVSIQTIIVVSIFLIIEYTLYNLFPVLAAVEDDDAPASYEAVASKDTVELEESEGNKTIEVDESLASSSKPITSSLRSTYRHVRSIAGKRSLLRGVKCWVILRFATFTPTFLLDRIPFVPAAVVWPIASLATLPLYTAWTHFIITEPNDKNFWYRLPPLGLVYRGVTRAALPYFLVRGFEGYIASTMMYTLVGWTPSRGSIAAWLLYIIAGFVVWVCLVIPAHAIFIRVQASLLREEDRTVVPLHHSITFHRAEGRQYMSTLDAWRSFSRASWARLFKLYAKISLFCLALEAVIALLAVAEYFGIIAIMGRK